MAKTKQKYQASLGLLIILLTAQPSLAGFEFKSAAPHINLNSDAEFALPSVGPSIAEAPLHDVTREAVPPIPSVASAPITENVIGFASDMPLAIALQQVVPAGYQFSFAPGVNPGIAASWTGGKPWQQVLTDMLARENLAFQLQNNVLIVMPSDNRSAAEETASYLKGAESAPYLKSAESAPIMIRPPQPSDKTESFPPPLPVQEVAVLPTVAEALTMPEEKKQPAKISWQPAFDASAWSVSRGDTLRDVLTRWTKMSGAELYWSIDYDYRISSNAVFSGSFSDAVGQLLDQFKKARPQPYGKLHQGEGRSKILIISSYDVPN